MSDFNDLELEQAIENSKRIPEKIIDQIKLKMETVNFDTTKLSIDLQKADNVVDAIIIFLQSTGEHIESIQKYLMKLFKYELENHKAIFEQMRKFGLTSFVGNVESESESYVIFNDSDPYPIFGESNQRNRIVGYFVHFNGNWYVIKIQSNDPNISNREMRRLIFEIINS